MIAAVAMLPLVGVAGLAVDYTSMSRVRTELQQALDTAVLAVAQKGSQISNAEAERIARRFLSGNLDPEYIGLMVLRRGTSVTVQAQVDVGLYFGGILGKKSMPVSAASSADVALLSYEIALVLDTTGSMYGGKLQAMKDAVVGLIDNISAQVPDKNRLKFSLVPFATFVNVGPQYGPEFDAKGRIRKGTGAAWLDLKGRSKIPQLELKAGISRFEVFHNLKQEWKGCVETRMPSKKGDHDVDDTPAVNSDNASLFVPAFAIDEPSRWEGYWNDYIASSVRPLGGLVDLKLKKYGVLDLLGLVLSPPSSTDFSDGKGPNKGCDMQPITPLSNDYKALERKVGQLQANGNTNIMEGVAWGMRVLSPHEPFAGSEPRNGLQKIMIVLTDGSNVFGNTGTELGSTYSSFGYLVDGRLDGLTAASSSRTTLEMNRKTLAACGNAKTKYDIDIYTIRLEEPDVATGTMLCDCASDPSQFFDAPSRSQLKDVFQKIGEKIIELRLSS
ncbi:pilus assembly protein TadG-related protein [Nitratireductor soli]|uniref:pilus assembly protein TadG-related protein n=1 Tax=Nitratireductor soli TaxID=1670619 RepID=UPI000A4847E3|nr:pilus assembly protein TadG-related protein [Nitratireductor soli]